jgi:hypothetical protein
MQTIDEIQHEAATLGQRRVGEADTMIAVMVIGDGRI